MSGRGAGRVGQPESVYGVGHEAIRGRWPISAKYHDLPRLFCPHHLGRNSKGQLRVLCYQYGGESESGLGPAGSSDNWRCISLDKLSRDRTAGRAVAYNSQPLAARVLVSSIPILMPKIIRNAIRNKDSAAAARKG